MLACLGFPVHFIPLSRCLLVCGCEVCLSLVYVYSLKALKVSWLFK